MIPRLNTRQVDTSWGRINKTALIGTLGPILTIFFGVWLLDESLTWWQMGGAALVLAGVMLISKISIRPGFMGLMDRTFLLYKK